MRRRGSENKRTLSEIISAAIVNLEHARSEMDDLDTLLSVAEEQLAVIAEMLPQDEEGDPNEAV